MRKVLVVGLIALLFALISGCGSSRSSSSTAAGGQPPAAQTSGEAAPPQQKVHLAKTKFVLHAGLAFGAFHRYIYKPFKRGTFKAAGKGRKALILAKGALAAAFAYHELKLAAKDAKSSPLLSKLISPLTGLAAAIKGIGPGLRRGQAPAGEIEQSNSQISAISSQSSQAGQPIKDVAPPASLQPV